MIWQSNIVDGISAVGHPIGIGLTGLVLWWMKRFDKRFLKLEQRVKKLRKEIDGIRQRKID